MINLRTAINDLGYGIVGLNLFKELIKITDVCLFPIGHPQIPNNDPTLVDNINKALGNQENFDPNSPTLTIWHEFALHERIGKGKNVALPFFELDKFTEKTKRSIQSQDHIIVPSNWAFDIIRDQVKSFWSEISVIPMGVDTNFFRPMNLFSDKPYRFLNIGKIEIRKGHDILCDLFNSAFTEEDDVTLYISWDNPFMSPADKQQWVDMYKNSKLGEKIHFIPRQPSVLGEYWAADCLIQPSRAEAICLPILEAMACGKPVITTNYSGMTAFCDKDNSYLVDIDGLEPARDGAFFHSDSLETGGWASFGDKQFTQFVEYMRFCYTNKVSTNKNGLVTADKLNWKNVAKNVLQVLNNE